MSLAVERASLVKALSTVAVVERRRIIRRFLHGLSTEELRYIAGYLGACLIESTLQHRSATRGQIAWDILQYEGCHYRSDVGCWGSSGQALPSGLEHKMILLLEYLSSCQCAVQVPIVAGSA